MAAAPNLDIVIYRKLWVKTLHQPWEQLVLCFYCKALQYCFFQQLPLVFMMTFNWKLKFRPRSCHTWRRRSWVPMALFRCSFRPSQHQPGGVINTVIYFMLFWEWLAIYLCWLSFSDLLCGTVQAGNPPQDFASWNIQLDLSHFQLAACTVSLSSALATPCCIQKESQFPRGLWKHPHTLF